MEKRELRNADIELIYLYIERIADKYNKDIYTNISLNLCSNMEVAYDYEKGRLHIEKRNNIPEDFWSLKQNGDSNVLDNVLILGENGIGKTTLLELIYAGNLENFENKLGNYMFLYSIKGADQYYIKSSGLRWIDQIDLEEQNSIKMAKEKISLKENTEFYSYFCKITRPHGVVTKGYCGLISVNDFGKVEIDQNIIEFDTVVQVKEYWTKMPMNGIYLSTSITENEKTGRFVSRKRIHHENNVTNLEITKFIFEDMQRENGIIKSIPYLSFSNITVKQLIRNRKEFIEDLRKIYVNLGMEFSVDSEEEKKYRFFANVWISFLLRLFENNLLEENFMGYLNKASSYKEIYENSKNLFLRLFIYQSNQLNERYQKLLQAIEKLDEEIFGSSLFEQISYEINWSIPIGIIAKKSEWTNQIMEFIYAKDDFESNLQYKIQKEMNWDYIPNFMMNHGISNMSTGETVLIANVFSKISKNMNKIITQDKGPYKKSVLLIMDEPDCTFHIRWTQQFVKYLIEFLNVHYPRFSFQIIMTSHMPFLATDYPRGNIICIPSEEWKKSQVGNDLAWMDGSRLLKNKEMYNSLKAFTPKYGFMSNYYDVVKDNFFVDIPIGMFAQNKFDELKKKVDLITGDTSEQTLENISMEIELIDEPVLKKYIYDSFQEKMERCGGRTELEKEAALLEKRLEEIKRRLSDMR